MQCSNATMRLYKPGVVWWRGRGKGGGPEWPTSGGVVAE
jgi:hypothetical protein